MPGNKTSIEVISWVSLIGSGANLRRAALFAISARA